MFSRGGSPRAPRVRDLVLALLPSFGLSTAAAQDPSEPPAVSDAGAPPVESQDAVGDLYKPLGPNLFPLYTHELRTSDRTEILQVLGGLFRRTSGPDGSTSTLVAPILFKLHSVTPPDDRLYVFPLYYHRESPDVSYDHLLPLFYSYTSGDSRFNAFLPFWVHNSSAADTYSRHHGLFPFFRYTRDDRIQERPVTSTRLGLWGVVELFETRATKNTRDRRGLNFFNWREETESGVSLFSQSWVHDAPPSGAPSWYGKTYLFPFYWHGISAESRYLSLVPLFGYWSEGETYDLAVFPLLSRFGGGTQATRLDLLFPFFHYLRTPRESALASYPLFDWYDSDERSRLGIFFWLYRRYLTKATGDVVHTVLFPLSYFRTSSTATRGTRWIFPYFESFDEASRWRSVVPLFLKRENYVDGKVDAFFTFSLPSYFSMGAPDDYFSTGFPLYWASHTGSRGWGLFLPFYFNSYSPVASQTHVFPFFSYRSLPAEKQFYFGGPLYIYRRFLDLEEQPVGSGHDVLWPLVSFENGPDGHHYRVLPLFWTSEDRNRTTGDLLITPFYYQQTTSRGTFHYLFPIHAHRETADETRDFYAAGTYMTHRAEAEDGSLRRSGVDLFWWLASFSWNYEEKTSHQHILPLGFWRTVEPAEHRTVAGPFYYSHRIVEEQQAHTLSLTLGPLFLSKRVDGPALDDVVGPATAAESGASVASAESGELVEYSTERGVLWPLSRWYRDRSGDHGSWVLPFFYRSRYETTDTLGLFPFYFTQSSRGGYEPNFLRYLYLFDREVWATGHRFTAGQLLFDWYRDRQIDRSRLRFLYPILEFESEPARFSYQVTPLVAGETASDAGERYRSHRVFPIFWEGYRERLDATGEWFPQSRHFYLFPLFGFEARTTRADYHLLYPLVHWRLSASSTEMELWPFFFYRSRPTLDSTRLWPFLSWESGEIAGESWFSRYGFFTKYVGKPDSSAFRLDPFLFRLERGRETFGVGGAFELMAYDRSPTELSYRLLPLVYGHADEETASSVVIPLYYGYDHGDDKIDYWWPFRILFVTNYLKGGDGERHFSILTKLFDTTSNVERPEFHRTRVLHQVYFNYRTETSRQLEINPLYQYYEDRTEGVTVHSVLFWLYRRETRGDEVRQTLFWVFDF